MKKLLISFATVAVAGVGPGAGAWAAPYPPGAAMLTLAPSSVAPGGGVTGVFSGCALGETVSFTLAGAITNAICDGGGGGTTGRLTAPTEGAATMTLTAPTTAGTYTVTAIGATGGLAAAATLAVVALAPAGGAGELPSTGSDSDRTLWIAVAALVLGLGLVVVAWQRRPAYSPLTAPHSRGGLFGMRDTTAIERRLRARGRLPWLGDSRSSAPPADSPYYGWRRHVKRAIDFGGVVLTFPITIPLVLAIAAGVKMTSRGPVFFRHERIGRHGDVFAMLKFRTMYVDAMDRLRADPELYSSYLRNDFKVPAAEDPRLVPFGRFLRRWSLDELPQLFNVLHGRMSLVGPRPVEAAQVESYGPWSWAYLDVKPGLTGRWQTTGRSYIHFPERAELDADYLEHWTLHGDFAILLKTIPCVLRSTGSD